MQSVSAQFENQETVVIKTAEKRLEIPPQKLITNLSFSHLVELFPIKDPLQRFFYEMECIKGTWSVRELRRQINTLYFERSALSKQPEKLSELTQLQSENVVPVDVIKSVYAFEFLGLNAKDIVEESDLEKALIEHIQAFILELGNGFCFEARQKRILIDEEYYFIDLGVMDKK